MDERRPYLVNFVSRADRRKAQNRVNQRAARRRKAERDAAERVENQESALPGVAPGARESIEISDDFDDEQIRALSASLSLSSSSYLDQARTLSPLLAEPRLRKTWTIAVNVLWPRLEYTDQRGVQPRELTRAFFRHGLADPLLFNAQCCSCSIAIAMSNHDRNAMNYMAIYHETQAVQLLRRELTENVGNPRDELLFAMLLLSSISKLKESPPILVEKTTFGAFKPPLTDLHNLHIGSSLHLNDVHREMLKRLIEQRGGISEITMPFLGEFFTTQAPLPCQYGNDADKCSMDLFQASVRCVKPDFGLCKSYLACLESSVPIIRHRHQLETTVHFAFPIVELEAAFQDLLWDTRCYMEMIKSYYRGTTGKPPFVPLALYRNLVQHRILSLDSDSSKVARELCRLALLLFSCVVVYPLQNLAPMQRYRGELTELMKAAEETGDDFRLWLLVLGAMAADQTALQVWYMSELKALAPKYGKAWAGVREVLEGFLWLDIACGEGALEIWHRVMLD